MKYFLTIITLFTIAWIAPPQAHANSFPTEVKNYGENLETCIHFGGEESYDRQRAKEINRGIKKYCQNFKQQDKKLRKRYSQSPKILKALDHWKNEYIEAFGDFNKVR